MSSKTLKPMIFWWSGGGLAGSVLARSIAMAGFRALVIEKEAAFKDRIRGEVLLPWGTVEAKRLGIYDILLANCATEAGREHFFYSGKPSEPRDFRCSTPEGTCTLSFYHPEMQECLLQEAIRVGVEVWRNATMTAVRSGATPEVDIAHDGKTRTLKARLIVGADGRESQLATLIGFDRSRDAPELFTGGLQLAGDLEIEHALHFFLHAISGRGSILIQTKPRNFRAHLLHHKDALPRRLSGARDFDAVVTHFLQIGLPSEWIDCLTPHGTFNIRRRPSLDNPAHPWKLCADWRCCSCQ